MTKLLAGTNAASAIVPSLKAVTLTEPIKVLLYRNCLPTLLPACPEITIPETPFRLAAKPVVLGTPLEFNILYPPPKKRPAVLGMRQSGKKLGTKKMKTGIRYC